jgi:hypothetical protein
VTAPAPACATCIGSKGAPRPAIARARNTRRPDERSWEVCERCFQQAYRLAPEVELVRFAPS